MIRKFGGTSGIDIQPQGIDLGLSSGGNIKSIQQGVANIPVGATSIDVAISSVDITKSVVILGGFKGLGGAPSPSKIVPSGALTSSTNLNFLRNTADATFPTIIPWQVVEFNNVKSLQTGTTTVTGTTEITTAISSIDITKSLLFFSWSTSFAANVLLGMEMKGRIVSETSLGFELAQNATATSCWQVIEFN